jgi:hypothetical protein
MRVLLEKRAFQEFATPAEGTGGFGESGEGEGFLLFSKACNDDRDRRFIRRRIGGARSSPEKVGE